jgi:chemotaxis family two-component system response regulator Rcp1
VAPGPLHRAGTRVALARVFVAISAVFRGKFPGEDAVVQDPSHNRPVEILLVEDNPDDIDLTLEAFKESSSPSRLHVVENGVDALAFLRRRGPFATAPRPDLILLDLNLPKKTGHEVLAEIKADPRLRQIPVIVLTTSAAEGDVARSYELAANCFITKPVDLDAFFGVVRVVDNFWRDVATLPR